MPKTDQVRQLLKPNTMRYIHFKTVKINDDKKKVKNLPVIDQKQLEKLILDKVETIVVTDVTRKASEIQYLEVQKMIFDDVAETLTKRKHFLAKCFSQDSQIRNVPIMIIDGDNRFMLNGLDAIATDIFYIKKIRENKFNDIKIYHELFKKIEAIIDTASNKMRKQFLKFPTKLTLQNKSITKNLNLLAVMGIELFGHKTVWEIATLIVVGEEGEGEKTDQYTSPYCINLNPTPNPKGFITNANWALKPHLTSVKNQGSKRGTCTAFGTIGAIETKVSVKYGKKINLSEQDLYKKQKLDWNPNIFDDYYEDGNNALMGLIYQNIIGHIFPFEAAWGYNRSQNRKPDPPDPLLRKYTNSCDGYSGLACSDTNHQANKKCYLMDIIAAKKVVNEACTRIVDIPILGKIGGWICETITDWVDEVVGQTEVCVFDTDIVATTGYKLTSFDLIWDGIWNNDIALAKLALSQSNPIIFAFTYADSMKEENHIAIDGKGFIVYSETEEPPATIGTHTVELVGFIDNETIPASMGITNGDGGGYFIIKNSYGICWGDMGFGYLPYSWVNKWGVGMIAVKDVQQV